MDTEPQTFMPPYNISWATFLSTFERMAADPPSRVDRSYLDSQSGTVQTYLIAAFRAFGLINDEARPTDAVNMFAEPDLRKELIGDLIKANYPTIVAMGSKNSTPGELAEAFASAFPSLTGESRVKGIRFFLSAAAYADLKLSPLWKAPKAPRGNSGRRSPRSPRVAQAASSAQASSGIQAKPQSMDEARLAYFDLLINNANEGTKLDPDVLDRIELLVGIQGAAQKRPTRNRADQRIGDGPNPVTSADPQ